MTTRLMAGMRVKDTHDVKSGFDTANHFIPFCSLSLAYFSPFS